MKHRGTVLLIEDSKELNMANSRALKLHGYIVKTAETIAQAKEQLLIQEPDIVLLDVMLPDGDGVGFCAEIREQTDAHILFLTAKTEHENIMQGLKAGGDDYITKPFHPEELLARIAAVMRRRRQDNTQIKKKGELTIDMVATRVFFKEFDLFLTPKEFSLFVFLWQNEGRVITAQKIYENIWKTVFVSDKNAVQTAISKLRQKLEPYGFYIDAVRGKGYIFREK